MLLSCMNPACGETWEGEAPQMCCDGSDCGCLGLPVEPIVCCYECLQALSNKLYQSVPHTFIVNSWTERNQITK